MGGGGGAAGPPATPGSTTRRVYGVSRVAKSCWLVIGWTFAMLVTDLPSLKEAHVQRRAARRRPYRCSPALERPGRSRLPATRACSSMDAMVELTRLRVASETLALAATRSAGKFERRPATTDAHSSPSRGDNLWGSQNSVRHERNRGFTGGAQVSAPRTGSRVQVVRTVNL